MNTLISINEIKRTVTHHQRINGRLTQVVYLCLDVLCVLIGAFLIFSIRFAPDVLQQSLLHLKWPSFPLYPFLPYCINFLLLYIVLIVLFFKTTTSYRIPLEKIWKDEALLILKGVSLATLILMVLMYLSKVQISRLVVLASRGLNLTTLASWRCFMHKSVERFIPQGQGVRNVLIVGVGKIGHKLATTLDRNQHLGLKVKDFIDDY